MVFAQDINITFKQEGYGRKGLYVNGYYLMSVFPNFDEHFGAIQYNNASAKVDENGNDIPGEYIDDSGSDVDVYFSKEQYMIDKYHDEIVDLLNENADEEE